MTTKNIAIISGLIALGGLAYAWSIWQPNMMQNQNDSTKQAWDAGCADAIIGITSTENKQMHTVMLNGKSVGTISTDAPTNIEILEKRSACAAAMLVMPDGLGGYINYAIAPQEMHMLNMQTGMLQKVMTPKSSVTDMSQDGKYAVGGRVVEGEGGSFAEMKFTNIETGEEESYTVPGNWGAIGDAYFSEDESKVAFSVAKNDPDAEESQLMIFDRVTKTFTLFGSLVTGEVVHCRGWVNEVTPRTWLESMDSYRGGL